VRRHDVKDSTPNPDSSSGSQAGGQNTDQTQSRSASQSHGDAQSDGGIQPDSAGRLRGGGRHSTDGGDSNDDFNSNDPNDDPHLSPEEIAYTLADAAADVSQHGEGLKRRSDALHDQSRDLAAQLRENPDALDRDELDALVAEAIEAVGDIEELAGETFAVLTAAEEARGLADARDAATDEHDAATDERDATSGDRDAASDDRDSE
jgi:hypothetical protein